MKLTDAFTAIIKNEGIKNIFGLQGGAVVHFFDSLERNKVKVTYNHHEESAALAATAYAKATNNISCVIVTTGPGSTNSITGLLSAWQDSVPCLFVSGQARSNHVSYGKKVRQVGTQEANIVDIVKPITKYAKFINKKEIFVDELIKAIKIAKSGRPGPVWIDVALDTQWSDIKFDKKILNYNKVNKRKKIRTYKYQQVFNYLSKSKKPLLILGYGTKGLFKEKLLKKFVKKFKIPFTTTWNSADIFPTNYNFNLGIIGMSGQRGANQAVFNSDLILCLGTHLAIPHTTTLYKDYAPKSKKIIINIDKHQLQNLNVKFDLKIQDDVENFLYWASDKKNKFNFFHKEILKFKKNNWYEPKKTQKPNSNAFIKKLTEKSTKKTCIIVDGGGTALYAGFQSSVIKENSRIICSSSISSMGTGLAETIGASKSKNFQTLICIIGDGSFLMNIQDLQNIFQDKINVKIILVNNNGYLAIRHTQKEFLKGRYYGTDPKGGLTLPNFKNVVEAFKIKYLKLDKTSQINQTIKKLYSIKGPVVCELFIDPSQSSLFKQGYKELKNGIFQPQSLSEMYPFIKKSMSNTNN